MQFIQNRLELSEDGYNKDSYIYIFYKYVNDFFYIKSKEIIFKFNSCLISSWKQTCTFSCNNVWQCRGHCHLVALVIIYNMPVFTKIMHKNCNEIIKKNILIKELIHCNIWILCIICGFPLKVCTTVCNIRIFAFTQRQFYCSFLIFEPSHLLCNYNIMCL